MPAKNVYHDAVVDALTRDGWTVTDDPLSLKVGNRNLHIDLGAERLPIGAERGEEKIAVEVQSFTGPSPVADLQQALGQFTLYRLILAEQQPERVLFLAIPGDAYDGIWSEEMGVLVRAGIGLRVLVFDPTAREVIQWIS